MCRRGCLGAGYPSAEADAEALPACARSKPEQDPQRQAVRVTHVIPFGPLSKSNNILYPFACVGRYTDVL